MLEKTLKFAILVLIGVFVSHVLLGESGVAGFGVGLGSMLLFSVIVDLAFHVLGWKDGGKPK